MTTFPASLPPLLEAGSKASSTVRLIDPSARNGRTCLLPAGQDVLAAHSGAGAAIGYSREEGQAGRLVRLSCGEAAQAVDTINEHLAGLKPARVVRVESNGASGETLSHWLFLPAASAGPKPMVVVPYPGSVYPDAPPAAPLTYLHAHANAQLLAGRGYAVLVPSIPLELGKGEPLSRLSDIVLPAVDTSRARPGHRRQGRAQ